MQRAGQCMQQRIVSHPPRSIVPPSDRTSTALQTRLIYFDLPLVLAICCFGLARSPPSPCFGFRDTTNLLS